MRNLVYAIIPAAFLTAVTAPAAAEANTGPAHAGLPSSPAREMPRARLDAVLAVRRYTVRRGDTLTRIAARYRLSWTRLWAANRRVIGANPNLIRVRQRLVLGQSGLTRAELRWLRGPWRDHPGSFAASTHTAVHHYACGDGDGDGFDLPCWKLHPGISHSAPVQAAAASPVIYSGGSGFQACVIARESGGNPSAVNPSSGAGGLYGFLPSTWAALGFPGLPENASVAMQNAAFAKMYAEAGTSPWAPFDGC